MKTDIDKLKEDLRLQEEQKIQATLGLASNLTKDLDIPTNTTVGSGWIDLGDMQKPLDEMDAKIGQITEENRAELEQYSLDIAASFGHASEEVQASTLATLATMGEFGQITIEKINAFSEKPDNVLL